ncbi:MAG: cysteine synthase A [Clostridia bacterium]|nr:cysteine synthase A [Clostridia bacterium]
MKTIDSLENLIGGTPLYRAKKIEEKFNLKSRLYLKLEGFNPAGSIKDRASLYMIKDAKNKGLITDGATIIEPTSGNTGIGVSMLSAYYGYKAVIVMPDTMSIERIKLMQSYGAKVVLTDGKLGMKGAIQKAKEINQNTPNSIVLGQFENLANKESHYQTTAKEIFQDLDGKVDVLIAGIGTGGTISGCGKFLKEKNANIQIYGIEPSSSPLLTKNLSGAHKIQGIGANFVPEILDRNVVDKVFTVNDEEAYEYTKLLANTEGLLCGISSGANLKIAVDVAKTKELENKFIVAIMPDRGERYLSVDNLF